MQTRKIVVIGAGPTGLGAAYRLHELGYENWVLYEKSDYVGGHSTSHVDEKGFVWDEGGHVIIPTSISWSSECWDRTCMNAFGRVGS